MTRLQTLVVALLTATYLLFELAFNARLLDVVGGAPTEDQLHHIEIFGRSLSGIAVALVLLQVLLGRGTAGWKIALACGVAAVLTYASLQVFVDALVARSTPAFRRASLSTALLQQALVQGRVELDGLGDDPGLFAKPAGKAFLALFPVMATAVDDLDARIRAAKLTLLAQQAMDKLGGARGAYDRYEQARDGVRQQWERYRQLPQAGDIAAEIRKQQDQAWNDYLADLGKRGWTPSSVPGYARATVVKKVQAKAPVPRDWDTADEATFREAVATQVRRRMGKAGAEGVQIEGRTVPPGLAWPAFLAHPAVQTKLRKAMGLPSGVTLQPGYGSGAEFDRAVVRPWIDHLAREALAVYDAQEASFADGRKNAAEGLHAARAVLVPPVALFFSLMGAVGHFAKLAYLLLRLLLPRAVAALQAGLRRVLPLPGGRQVPAGLVLPLVLIATVWGLLAASDNAVTTSRLFTFLRGQMLAASAAAAPGGEATLGARWRVHVLHVVAVGQGHGYPLNEWVRTHVLQGITYGYHPENPDKPRR